MTVRKSYSSVETNSPLERVQNHALPEQSIPLLDSYEAVVGDRDRFLWKWAHHLFPKFTFSCVAPEHLDRVQRTKLDGLLFVSILDDIAEKQQDLATFEEAAKIPFDHLSVNRSRDGIDLDAVALASDTWDQFSSTIQDGPRAEEFDDVIQFDLKQVLNAMEYSYIANQNLEFVTESEVQMYDAHNMMLFGFADIDLIHSPTFDRSELSTLRDVIGRAQQMVRIGNWVTTWEREIAEGDFSSGIVAYALEHDIVSTDDLRATQGQEGTEAIESVVAAIDSNAVEEVFLRQWSEELAAAREFEDEFDSVDVGGYLDGIETVMEYHLASRGLK